jgi:hypothetical protein
MILSSGWNERQRLWVNAWIMMRHYLISDKGIDPSGVPNTRRMKDAEEDVVSCVVLRREKGVS